MRAATATCRTSGCTVRRGEIGSIGRFFTGILLAVLIFGLGAAVVYLLSDINHRHYRLSVVGDTLLLERGQMLPMGFVPYVGDTNALRAAYAPIPLPPNETFPVHGIFEDRSDVDRALFGMLSGWARQRLESTDGPTLELAETYVKRLESLPGLSEEQRIELRTLRANLAFRDGGRLVADLVNQLHRAQAAFHLALELGTTHPGEAQAALNDIARKLQVYEPVAAPPAPPPAAKTGP